MRITRTIPFFLLTVLSFAGCSNDKVDESVLELEAGTSLPSVLGLPDTDIVPGSEPVTNSLKDTAWKLKSFQREDGTLYPLNTGTNYALFMNTKDFRIHFWCEYRGGNYVENDGALFTTSLPKEDVFDCSLPPIADPEIEILLTEFFDEKTIMFVRTGTDLELRSLVNEVLVFSTCEADCLNPLF